MPTTRKPLLVNLAWAAAFGLLLAVVYVLSYAPVYRCVYGANPGFFLGSAEQQLPSIFRPVEWLTDRTPLQRLLFKWADQWGVADGVRYDSRVRSGFAVSASVLLPAEKGSFDVPSRNDHSRTAGVDRRGRR
jgi:hypothetical protein